MKRVILETIVLIVVVSQWCVAQEVVDDSPPTGHPSFMRQIDGVDRWLQSVARTVEGRVRYPVATETPQEAASHLYSGLPGVMLFYWHAHQVTGHARFLDRYRAAAASVQYEIEQARQADNPALFTGYAGLGWALLKSDPKKYETSIVGCIDLLKRSAISVEGSAVPAVTWNQVTDVIGGSAGIGFFLIESHQGLESADALNLAVATGDGLLTQAQEASIDGKPAGLKWMMRPDFPREMPNYSHGTAGICDFLLTLDEVCIAEAKQNEAFSYDGRFQDAAIKGVRYLAWVDQQYPPQGLLPHHFGEGQTLNYLGWCHGPVGTCQLTQRLTRIDPDSDWKAFGDRAVKQLVRANLAIRRTDGFWENVGLCCGSAGVASFLLDEGVRTRNPRWIGEAYSIADDLVQRATSTANDEGQLMLSWPSAEHRVRPELIQTQTGLMQGAAGVGLFLLQLESMHRNPDNVPFSIFGDIFP